MVDIKIWDGSYKIGSSRKRNAAFGDVFYFRESHCSSIMECFRSLCQPLRIYILDQGWLVSILVVNWGRNNSQNMKRNTITFYAVILQIKLLECSNNIMNMAWMNYGLSNTYPKLLSSKNSLCTKLQAQFPVGIEIAGTTSDWLLLFSSLNRHAPADSLCFPTQARQTFWKGNWMPHLLSEFQTILF
jgi:hypothetical protein